MYLNKTICFNKIQHKLLNKLPKKINLSLMSKREFDIEMENRYNEALREIGMGASEYFRQFKNRIANNGKYL